ncbi:T-cell surface glycoprotein CD3 epsilon chain-like [Cheilinus undulatus]|uniref:T-cell surface glycoprotein CD3 epsilon chain-like n=1 Tax=Cheilinus undulatus TaxID=241271 RepID=UPI001BD6B424|nr:T-cell surface glycoprotein CD3 epsilon chain-like [Cheilinus undulatus]
MGVGAALTVLVLFIATVDAGGGVSFWGKKFTMTCPEEGEWFKNKDKLSTENTSTYEVEYDNKKKGSYHCVTESGTYHFYVQGKVCESCFELDAALIGFIILLDVVGTAVIMSTIYKCSKNKRSDGPSAASKGPSRSGGRGPPVPSPDYEHLNIHTREQETYSKLNRTR